MRKDLEFLIFPPLNLEGGNMIEVYKILTGKYHSLISPHFPLSSSSVTRGNSFKIITRSDADATMI